MRFALRSEGVLIIGKVRAGRPSPSVAMLAALEPVFFINRAPRR
jgi:hypothetical protein